MKKISYDNYLKKETKKDSRLIEKFEEAKKAIDIAQQIYDLRKKRGLTQAQFAKEIGISQSNVARLESADYKSYSLRTLSRAAEALNSSLDIKIVPIEETSKTFVETWITTAVNPSFVASSLSFNWSENPKTIFFDKLRFKPNNDFNFQLASI